MSREENDLVIAGAGPVGLLCAYLAQRCGLRTAIVDKTAGPLEAGRADALNARTLQLLEIADLFDALYPHGKTCDTSSVWADGAFVSRQSAWWKALDGCFHKHFLMLGQSHLERLLDDRLKALGAPVLRDTAVEQVELGERGCLTRLSDGRTLASRFVIGADGSRSPLREAFGIGFEIRRPQLIWAVIDGVVETDFAKVPEIIVFQAETSDVAWIPREGDLDRFYVRMDTQEFSFEQAVAKINRAMRPHTLRFSEVAWFSRFSVKEAVAERYAVDNRLFLAGDACHIHSVNGGQGLNTGLADAFNLIWKMHLVLRHGAPQSLLASYQDERKPVALGVVETSSQLVHSTKYSSGNTHAQDYVKIVERRAGYITGMGIAYGDAAVDGDAICGKRLPDFMVRRGDALVRVYSLLDYRRFALLLFGDCREPAELPAFVQTIRIDAPESPESPELPYPDGMLLVRPDAHIAAAAPGDGGAAILACLDALMQRETVAMA